MRKSQQAEAPAVEMHSGDRLPAMLRSPVLWGVAVTLAFYAALPHLPIDQTFATRYFRSHPVEHTSIGLFFVGMAMLIAKLRRLIREREALRLVRGAHSSCSQPGVLASALPRRLRGTFIEERLREASEHLETSPSSSAYSEHLKYLSELAGERLHSSYALIRVIGWAIPILGFLGTVIGITMAIAFIKPEQLSSSLDQVTGNLAVAFDTTALALAMSLILVFSQFSVERAERAVLDDVEGYSLKKLAPAGPSQGSPLMQAEMHAASQIVSQTDTLLRTQTEVWQNAMESVRQQWHQTLDSQREQLGNALSSGLKLTLTDHAEGLKSARTELVAAVTECANRFDSALEKSDERQARHLDTFSRDLSGLWDRARGDLEVMRDRYQEQLSTTITSAHHILAECRGELKEAAAAARSHRDELARHGEILERVAGESADVIRLEGHLVQNLEALRATDTLQDAVHSLTAAAHILNTRTRNRAA